jgi:hypothetical protein
MTRLLFLIISSAFLALCEVQAADVETTTAPALLERMGARYAALRSYTDTISVHFRNPDGAPGASAECKVWFARPSFLRIDGESRRAPDAPARREVIWSDGESARAWSTSRAVTLLGKIQLAGSKMFGTYAYHIPTMLDRSFGGERRLNQLGSPTIAGDEQAEGVNCHHVRGDWLGDPYEVWLGKDDLLVRKITADYKGYLMEEIHRDIAVDQPIARKIFQFAPEQEDAAAPAPAKKTQ